MPRELFRGFSPLFLDLPNMLPRKDMGPSRQIGQVNAVKTVDITAKLCE